MSAIVPKNGPRRQLDRPGVPTDKVTPEDTGDPKRLARIVMGILEDVARLKRRFWPDHIDFEDVDVDSSGTTKTRLAHNFGQRVRWWVVDCSATSAGGVQPPYILIQNADTDLNTLVLTSNMVATVTIRVEAAG